MAKVVFSDGSKAMAHNLDDQYERWMLRREELAAEEPYLNPDRDLEMFVPELPVIETGEQAEELRDMLIQKQMYVQTQQSRLNLSYKSGEIVKGQYEFQRAPLAIATSQIMAQVMTVNNFIKAANGAKRRANLQSIKPAIQLIDPNAANGAEAHATIKALRKKQKDGSISTREQIQLDEACFAVKASSLFGAARLIAKAEENGEVDFVDAKRDRYIQDLTKELADTQRKLIKAYERIIGLESEKE